MQNYRRSSMASLAAMMAVAAYASSPAVTYASDPNDELGSPPPSDPNERQRDLYAEGQAHKKNLKATLANSNPALAREIEDWNKAVDKRKAEKKRNKWKTHQSGRPNISNTDVTFEGHTNV